MDFQVGSHQGQGDDGCTAATSQEECAFQDVTLVANPLRAGRRTYQAWHEGELLLSASNDPEFDACRALQAKGLGGKLRVRWNGSDTVAMTIDIAWGAGKRCSEGVKSGPRVANWEPFSEGLRQTLDERGEA